MLVDTNGQVRLSTPRNLLKGLGTKSSHDFRTMIRPDRILIHMMRYEIHLQNNADPGGAGRASFTDHGTYIGRLSMPAKEIGLP